MIPAIDIAPLFAARGAKRDATDAAILAAAQDIGFMTVSNLPGATLSAATRKRLLALFSLSEPQKRALFRQSFAAENPNVYRGWFALQDGHPTHKEGIDIGPDLVRPLRHDPADPLTEPTPLPDLPDWRAAAAEYYRAMEATGAKLMQALAQGLGLDETAFDAAFRNGISTLRLIRYPVRRVDELDPTHRVGSGYMLGAPHVDSGFVTLLAQDGVAGLEVADRAGNWIGVTPTEGTLVVNFGKLLERWTGGKVRATRHRVVGSGTERFSIPFFYEPSVDAVIAPLGLGESFEPVAYGDHLWEATTKFIEQRGIAHLRKPAGRTIVHAVLERVRSRSTDGTTQHTCCSVRVRKTKLSPLRIGTAGWSVPRQYANDFKTEGSHLERYAQRLNCAEINSSFYRPHRRAVYERWAAATPPDFRFAVKVPRTMTHEKGLAGCGGLIGRFAEEVGGLGEKLAVLLIQLPPSAPMRKRTVDAFAQRLRGALGVDLAIEPRHPGWFSPENDLWLAERHIARVAADPVPKRVPIESGADLPGGWGGLAYYRWHGSPRVYYSDYPVEQLKRLRRRAAGDRQAGRSVWCIFDNTAGGHALGNALWLTDAPAEAR